MEKIINKATLLVGPTGSGKTPLGDYIAKHGLLGEIYHHFDFGENLRQIAESNIYKDFFSEEELQFIKAVLSEGLLLEDDKFYLAGKILKCFVNLNITNKTDHILLNGLPRHLGQAEDVSSVIQITSVINLCCSAQTVLSRIYNNYGGDRGNRIDDHIALVNKKLEIYNTRTKPLINYYKEKNCPIYSYEVSDSTKPGDFVEFINR